jgi:tetratricopeptide (TPR) repeat protein
MSHKPDPDALLDAAIERHAARDLDAAERLYKAALEVQPDHPEALNLLGLLLQDRGQLDESIALISRAIEIDAEFPEAHANLARGLSFRGETEQAVAAARKATELDPDLGEGWLQLGRASLDLARHEEALTALRQALRHFPADVSIHSGIGYAAQHLGDLEASADAWRKVLELQPDRLEALVNLGAACSQMKLLDEALDLHRRAVSRAPDDVTALGALAATYHQRFEAAELIPACRAALALAPDRADLLTILASGLMWLGRIDEAAESCEAAIRVKPDYIPAQQLLGVLKPDTLNDLAITRFQLQMGDPTLSVQDRASAAFCIANALDADGDYGAAFGMYQTANGIYHADARSSGTGFNLDSFKAYIDWARGTFNSSIFAELRDDGSQSDLPVFIVGMPRSGTSLVEQIAASHPRVFGAGERKDIAAIVTRINRGARNLPIRRWDRKQLRDEAEQQISHLRQLGGDVDRVIDKMPDNVKALGQIRLLFPNARIIVCRRDPRDVCVSCFTTHFGAGLNWSWDIEDCARQHVEIERLLDHWLTVLPGPILEINYETMVENMEAESRRLISFLGLEWDPACLEFHKTERSVTTASALQVRRPLYSSSVGKWRRYEAHLGPMTRILEEHGLITDASAAKESAEAEAIKLGGNAMSRGDLPRALEIFQEASHRFPLAHEIHANLALTLEMNGQLEKAIDAWRSALAIQPDHPRSLAHLGFLLTRTGCPGKGVEILKRAVELQPDELENHRALALALWEVKDLEGTRAAYLRGLSLAPCDQDTLLALGHFEAMLGRFEDAATYYRRILSHNPGMTEARLSLLTIGKVGEAGDLAELQSVLTDQSLPERNRIMAGFALGKAHDSAGDYDSAFAAYRTANALARARGLLADDHFGEADAAALIDRLIQVFPATVFPDAAAWGDPSELPVFIVGVPRSGTSLVEQILASHPRVFGAGERADIIPATQAMVKTGSTEYPGGWELTLVRREAQAEVARLRGIGGDAVRVIDKLPGNVFWLGHIRLMLPKARIIVCRRDPRDIGLSAYFNYLSAFNWTTDLYEVGAHIRETDRMIAHWCTVLPGPLMEIQYEDLVGNLEGESRRLVEFLGLEWDPACLDFHRTERAVSTASVWQVRQKLYDSSIGRWRHYQQHLEPLFDGLRGSSSDPNRGVG